MTSSIQMTQRRLIEVKIWTPGNFILDQTIEYNRDLSHDLARGQEMKNNHKMGSTSTDTFTKIISSKGNEKTEVQEITDHIQNDPLLISTLIYTDDQLHTPMYLFLCNLALVDICYTTTTVPKLLYMLLSGDNTVSFTQCFTQMYFYISVSFTEDLLIFVMAYDRYVAICNPLHYHFILNRKNCLLFVSGIWISGYLNAIALTIQASNMFFCHSDIIHHFFCDIKALINISCAGSEDVYIVIYLDALIFGVFPVMFSLTSYIKIIRVILQIKSKGGRKKAFSTCSSHLTVVTIYYAIGSSVYMMSPSESSKILEPVFTVVYAVVTPMINPLIYSLRNKEVKLALLRILR
ncbi:olfactory receptor 1G1-like [Mixophyes fleayi]|uniref:olfactory receptor 1G1-like n=1 Tax=Mixophyes fleayi TaxID=3061075 RepID=UPI003F4E1491